MSSGKRVGVATISPLEDAGILLQILNILGPGQHLFISAVSKAWRESYARVDSATVPALAHDYDDEADLLTVTSEMTLYSAAFSATALVRLAHGHGFALEGYNDKLERIAGRVADVDTLRAAHELGLQLTDKVLFGAAESLQFSVKKLQWLHDENGCELSDEICFYAARSGSIEALRWLKLRGGIFRTGTCEGAAAGAHLHVLQYLRSEGCEWDGTVCSAAAKNGHLTVLQWLHEQGCPWSADHICSDAAESGSMEMLLYLKQQGCEFNEQTMAGAAGARHLFICQFLVAEQCPFDGEAPKDAAGGGHLEVVRFLLENGCPWDPTRTCVRAAWSTNIELLQFLKQQGCILSAQVMSNAAQRGDLRMCQYLHAEQCPWGESACWNAACEGHVDTLRWLHEQGCPWHFQDASSTAARRGHLHVIVYMLGVEPEPSAAQLTELLNAAGVSGRLSVAKWLRQQGAEWPAVLRSRFERPWSSTALQWARAEGCTSPA
jgi:hypothetical protein